MKSAAQSAELEAMATTQALRLEVESLRAQNLALREELATLRAVTPANATDVGFFERVLSAVPNVVYVWDLEEQRPVFVNAVAGRRLGLAPGAMQSLGGDVLPRLAHPEDLTRLQAHMVRLSGLRDGEVSTVEYRLRDQQGGWHWFEALNTVFSRRADGRAWQAVGTATEITERKHAELSLRESASAWRSQLDRMPMAIIEFDAQTIVRRWAGEAERMFGWREDEVLGRPLRDLDLVHPEDRAGVQQVMARLRQGEQHLSWSNRNLTRDRATLHCIWHNSWRSGEGGAPPSVLAMVFDVTARQCAEDALSASEERHRLLAETMLHGVVHQGADGRIIAMNPAAVRILGKSRERFLGSDSVQEQHDTVREDGSLFPGEEHPSMQALRSGEPVRGVVMGVWNPQAQQRRWIRIDAVPVRRPGQAQPAEVYAVFEDITDARRAEGELREADRHKDLFIATLAHELRNPLAPILSAAMALRARAPADAATIHCSGVIERQVVQMARLLDDLLDVSRVASGRMLLKPEPLLLAQVIDEAVETARPLISAAGHTLDIQLPPQPLRLHGDRVRLAQVIANLLTNAAKYTQPRGHIAVLAAREGDEAVVRVRDSGIGLASEHLHSVFEMFGQVDAAIERSQGGLGIGLALAKGLVEMHGGSIRAQSEGPGRGSEFEVHLPLARDAVPAPGSAPLLQPDAPPLPAGRRILVVDDNRDAAETLAMLLSVSGHDVQVAHDGVEALALAEAWSPDVVLLDIGLPRLNGYEVCRGLRRRQGGAALLVVAISGWGQEQDRRRSTEAGFDAHLVKPVQHAQLEALLAAPLAAPRGTPPPG